MTLASIEMFWRSQGHRPSVVDNPELWAQQRSRVYGGKSTIILIGMSRMQFDFVSDVFHERFPQYRLIRLAAPFRHVVSSLRDLANDDEFQGTILASVVMPWMREGVLPGYTEELNYYKHRYNAFSGFNRSVASFVQSHLVSVNPLVNLRDVVVTRITEGRWPKATYYWTQADRSRQGDYDLHPNLETSKRQLAENTRTIHQEKHLSPEQAMIQLQKLTPYIKKIQSRGGQVAFIRFPTTGQIWAADEEFYPKREYWDRFAAQIGAPALHFRDVPAFANFECADGSHLDMRDAPHFTHLLLDELVRLGVLTD